MVHDVIHSAMKREDPAAVHFLSAMNDWQEALLADADKKGWGHNEIGLLAMAAILDEIARFCRTEADDRVMKARREYGTTWASAAKALGYSTPNAVARRVDPVQRDESNKRNRELRAQRSRRLAQQDL
ncbi:MAG: hypothetical protein E6640_01775 [Actinomyces urogenitalis]|uniref:hypothetical protein n=1 Tax=Actinomyces urogenitalis TaxID=103621 RepID=UPI00290B98B5|nr:hypothetical protein [Actinomyces urogenitalis]MDU6150940.1 hypothetical protein [Actinomyces urogenitalis]